jgi:hypothetical protein
MCVSFNGSLDAAYRFDYAWAFREVRLQPGRLPNFGSGDAGQPSRVDGYLAVEQGTASTNVGPLEFNSLVRLQG